MNTQEPYVTRSGDLAHSDGCGAEHSPASNPYCIHQPANVARIRKALEAHYGTSSAEWQEWADVAVVAALAVEPVADAHS